MPILNPNNSGLGTTTNAIAISNISASTNRKPMKQFECGIHSLTYESDRAGCPVCWHERESRRLKEAFQEVNGKMRVMSEKMHTLEAWYDLSISIRDAIPLLSDDDLAFLKVTLYEWRNKKSLSMKVTRGARKKKRQPSEPNGFVVVPRQGDPYGYLCTSVGGVAIADYFDEAMSSYGAIRAMDILVRGMSQHLPGGQDE